ncbi:methyltransferase domain-containing protein [bacterium]|nr:methyltransferase domain-containing protein [bacterium]
MKIAQPYIHDQVLDLGCGFAEVTDLIPPTNYVGIDGHPKIVEWLMINHPGYKFYHYDLDHDQLLLDRQFDTIMMLAVIEHLKYPDNILSQIPNLLKDDGLLIMTAPAPAGDIVHQVGAKIRLFSEHAVEQHEIIFTHQSMGPYLTRNGLKIKEYRPFLLGANQLFICETIS